MKKHFYHTGFTIIEVALVLAIAGLIFLMVFIALPSLRASQRDTDRREDITSFISQVKDYQKNNRGALPGGTSTTKPVEITHSSSETGDSTWSGFYKHYLGDNFIDPSGEYYVLEVDDCRADNADSICETKILEDLDSASFPNGYRMYVILQATCRGSDPVATVNPRKLAVLYKLEGAGVYCSNT